MWLAHHFPGLSLTVEDVDRLTPEQTTALFKAGRTILDGVEKNKVAHTTAIMKSVARF